MGSTCHPTVSDLMFWPEVYIGAKKRDKNKDEKKKGKRKENKKQIEKEAIKEAQGNTS
jgi:hypothetical protein